ncbi:hypothetical protein [Amycolatopsis jejuensis]|uniref:hypothetical protein n=1 Tax=Amycolatopsis jejuensis TaxID=330084 RepID=UPI0005271227|nr:hypothetical protein [Amycolatopsis jejuensis]
MRLVRLGQQPSRVAEDVRAALASLGRGSTVIGGVALVGARPTGDRPVEAVVVLPTGVLIVIGVDLPDPALHLEAPLSGPWKADGWPLVHGDEAVNPATEALDLSQECERRVAELGGGPVGTIVAVGPYVETVDQPPGDLAGPVRVLHPTPTTMLAATVSLATARHPRSVDQARALIAALAPEAPALSEEVLRGEGFVRFADDTPVPGGAGFGGSAASTGAANGRTTGQAAETTTSPPPAAPSGTRSTGTVVTPAAPPGAPVPLPGSADTAQSQAATPASAATPLPASADTAQSQAATPETSTPASPGTAPSPRSPEEVFSPPPSPPKPQIISVRPPRPEVPTSDDALSEAPTESTEFPADSPTEKMPSPARPPAATGPEQPRPPAAAPTQPRPQTVAVAVPPPAEPGKPPSRTVKWVPLGAIVLLVVLVVAAIVVATSGSGNSDTATPPPASTPSAAPVTSATSTAPPAPSLTFEPRASSADQRCASHAFGDVQASLQQTSCSGVRRASYTALVDGRAAAVTVAVVEFPDAAQAGHLKEIADTPGGGGILDVATETGKWPAAAPKFDGAAYASKADGNGVRLVQAVWQSGPSTPDDPGLARAAKGALDLELPA